MLRALVGMVIDLGVTCLAEGVETPAESDTCLHFGFRYAQGYLYGKPVPVDEVVRDTVTA